MIAPCPHPSPEAKKLAVLLCHYDGIPKVEIAEHFVISPRWINKIIAKPELKYVKDAVALFKGAREKYREKIVRHTLLIDDSVHIDLTPRDEIAAPAVSALKDKTTNARFASQLKAKTQKIESLKLQIANLRKQNLRLRETLNEIQVSQGIAVPEVVTDGILAEMVSLQGMNKYARRYSEKMLRFAYVFMTLSPRAYKFARKVLVLPSRSTIYSKFSGLTREIKECLTDLEKTYKLIVYFIDARMFTGERLTCCLGIDAFAFRLFLRQIASISAIRETLSPAQLERLGPLLEDKELTRRIQEIDDSDDEFEKELDEENACDLTPERISQLFETYNSCFLYCLLPLNSDFPCFPLHLSPASNGISRQCNIDVANALTKLCGQYNIDVVYIAVDGDPGWNDKFADMEDVVASEVRQGPVSEWALDVYKTAYESGTHCAIGDLLHIVKRARSRYIDHKISILSASPMACTNYEKVCSVLGVSMALCDKSPLGRMRDFYPVELFTMSNVLNLLRKGLFPDAFYFTAFTLLLLAIRVPFWNMTLRLKMLNLAFLLMNEMMDELDRVKVLDSEDSLKITQRACASCDMITFGERSTLTRILCTIVSYCAAFQVSREMLRTDALGTHIVEQFIGNGRHGGDSRWERILATFCQSTIRTVFLGMDNIRLSIPGRLKTAGFSLRTDGDLCIEDFDECLIAKVLVHSLTPEGRAASDFAPNLERVKSWFSQIDEAVRARKSEIGQIWAPSPVTNSGIMARLCKGCLKECTILDQGPVRGQ